MMLQRYWAFEWDSRELGVVYDSCVVEDDCEPISLHGNDEAIPLPNGVVGGTRRCHAGSSFC